MMTLGEWLVIVVTLALVAASLFGQECDGDDCPPECAGLFEELVALEAELLEAGCYVDPDPDCQEDEDCIFADGFEEGDTLEWSVVVP